MCNVQGGPLLPEDTRTGKVQSTSTLLMFAEGATASGTSNHLLARCVLRVKWSRLSEQVSMLSSEKVQEEISVSHIQ